MQIECPRCSKKNKIELDVDLNCTKCKKSFKGFKFARPKILTVCAAFLFAATGGYYINGSLNKNRYPLNIEYGLVNNCIIKSNKTEKKGWLKNQRRLCTCAVELTVRKMSYKKFLNDPQEYSMRFIENFNKCN